MWAEYCVEKLHTQFYKYYFGLNKRAPNVASRNEAGRLSLKSKIYENILKFWIHLENLPENSIAYQCLQISKNLAMFSSKTCFISSVNKIVDLFQAWNQQNTNVNFKDKGDSSKWLTDMKQNIEHQSKIHQIKLINSNRNLFSIQLSNMIPNIRHFWN